MKKFSSLVILSFIAIMLSAFVLIAANPTIQLTPLSPTTICATGNDTLLYSVNASNIPANTNVVIYQSTDSTFNPSLGQGDSIGFVKGDTASIGGIITSTCPKILGIFIDACNDSGRLEPANEYMVITSGRGFRVANLKVDVPNTSLRDINTGSNPCSFGTPSNALMTSLRTGFCNSTNLLSATQSDSIPPDAIVIIFTGAGTDYPYNLSRFCQTGQKIYILQNACTYGSGAFVNNDAAGTTCSGATASTRYRTTTISNRSCFDELTYDRCGLNEFDGANPNANDGNYVIRLQNTDTSSVVNGGIQNNAADRCNGVVLDSIIKIQTLKFAIPTAFCNTGMHYIKAILKPQTQPTTISNTIQFQYICNDVRATSSTTNICSGDSSLVNISSTDPNATFSWTVSGGANINGAITGTGNIIKQQLTYTGIGTKDSVTYNISSNDNGCTKTTSIKVVVNKCDTCNATVSISGNTIICNGSSTTLTAGGDFDSLRWSTGATTASINVNQQGSYNVVAFKGNCTVNDTVTVTNTIVSPTISGDNVVCGGASITLTVNGVFDSVRWNTNAITNAINVIQGGNYSVNAYLNGCLGIASQNVNQLSSSFRLDKINDTICAGDTARFILFSGDDPQVPIDTFTFTNSGKYPINYTSTCGNFIDSVTVVVNTVVEPTITGNLSICTGQSTTLDAGIGYDSYIWQPNGEITQTVSVNTAGTYTVTVKSGNCSASDAVTVRTTTTPTAFTLGNDTAFCGSFTKILSTGNQSTIWSIGITASQITITTAGTYYATISNACGIASDTIIITQNLNPIVNLGNDTSFCDGDLILTPKSIPVDVRSYLWSTGAQTDTIRISTVGTYSIKVTNINGCSDSDAVNITSNCENDLWLPNAFTPDGNGNNDVFYVRGNPNNLTIEKFVIFNRWGNKVFEANNILPNDPTKGWNGFYKDKIDQLEVYGYMVIAKFNNGEKRTLKGNVTLIK